MGVSTAMQRGLESESRMLRILIVASVRLYGEGLVELLSSAPALQVVGPMHPSGATPEYLAASHADVVLVDSSTAIRTDVCRRVAAMASRARIVAFAVAEENEAEVLACAREGVSGFVACDASRDDLIEAIVAAGSGAASCSPRVTATLIRCVAASPAGPAAPPDAVKLTPREYQIAQRLEAGLTNKEIAAALGISVITVKNHVHNILGKLSLRRRGEAAAVVRTLHAAPAARLAPREI